MPQTMVGRREESARVRELVAASRLVTLTGPGGVGKTTLATAVADELSRVFDGAWFADLSELTDPELVLPSVARAAGVHLRSVDRAEEELVDAVGQRRALLVIDGCDRLVRPTAALVTALLAPCPELRVLATSRQPLRVTGESVLGVEPLAFPDPDADVALGDLTKYDAVTLFVQRATRHVPDFRLTQDNAAAVAGICAAVQGMPLAVELAAARVPVLSPQSILERLDDRYRLLTKGARGAPDHLSSLRASVDASHEQCTPAERLLWARLSVFAGGFALDAAEAVCAGAGLHEHDVLDLVDSLLERSVLTRDDADPTLVRYRMLETLRAYGAERLGDDAGPWRTRHAEWYTGLAERFAAEWFGAGQVDWCRRMRGESANLRAALEHALESPATASLGLRTVASLEAYWVVTGRVSEARRWLARALETAPDDADDREGALLLAAELAALQGDRESAAATLEEARERDTGRRDPAALARAEGWAAAADGDLATAASVLYRAARTSRDDGDPAHEALALLLVGLVRGFAGSAKDATEALRECLALTEPIGEHYLRSSALAMLGVHALEAGDLAGAEHAGRESLRLKAELDDQFGIAFALTVLGCAAVPADPGRGATLFGAADLSWRTLGLTAAAVPGVATLHQSAVRSARDQLGAARFAAAGRRGAGLDAEQVRRFALEGVLEETGRTSEVSDTGPLTAREFEVAELVAKGLSNKDVAEALVISPRTAQGHVENILRKLALTSRTQVAAWVLERTARSPEA